MVLMLGGGVAALQALTISISLPFSFLIVLMAVGLYLGLRDAAVQLSVPGE